MRCKCDSEVQLLSYSLGQVLRQLRNSGFFRGLESQGACVPHVFKVTVSPSRSKVRLSTFQRRSRRVVSTCETFEVRFLA